MFIRSQDKLTLVGIGQNEELRIDDCYILKVRNVKFINRIFRKPYHNTTFLKLGKYKSEERAIEVLDDIESFFNTYQRTAYKMPKE